MNEANPLLQDFQTLKQQVQELAQYKNAVVERQEDQAYIGELESIKKQYPKIDLATPDETGKSLEYKILEHAQQNGIKKFSIAFKDYMHDELLKLKEEEAKEKLIKDKNAKSKLGILDVSTTPTKSKQIYQKGKSYNENKSFTATFDERPFIVGWDFKVQEPRSGRSGDFYAESANMGTIS